MKRYLIWFLTVFVLFVILLYRIFPKNFSNKGYIFKNKEIVGVELENFELKKQNGEWFVKSKGIYKADKSKIDEVLDNLSNFQILEVVSKSSNTYDSYSVNEEAFKFSVIFKSKKDLIKKKVYLGKVGGFSHLETYVRLGDKPQVFLARGIDKWNLKRNFYDFCDKTIIKFEKDNVEFIEVDFGNKILKLKKEIKDNTTTWFRLKDKKIIELNKIDEILDILKDFSSDSILELEQPPVLVELRISLIFDDKGEIILNFYKKTTENIFPLKLILKSHSSKTIKQISQENVIYGLYDWRFQNLKEKLLKI